MSSKTSSKTSYHSNYSSAYPLKRQRRSLESLFPSFSLNVKRLVRSDINDPTPLVNETNYTDNYRNPSEGDNDVMHLHSWIPFKSGNGTSQQPFFFLTNSVAMESSFESVTLECLLTPSILLTIMILLSCLVATTTIAVCLSAKVSQLRECLSRQRDIMNDSEEGFSIDKSWMRVPGKHNRTNNLGQHHGQQVSPTTSSPEASTVFAPSSCAFPSTDSPPSVVEYHARMSLGQHENRRLLHLNVFKWGWVCSRLFCNTV